MACTVLKKQIECIDGKKENITVPSVAMKKYREKEQSGKFVKQLNEYLLSDEKYCRAPTA